MSADHPPLPPSLVAVRRAGKLIPFVGAGLSLGTDVKGGFPTWGDLPRRLLDECKPHHWQDDHDRQTLRARFFKPDPADATKEVPRVMTLRAMLSELDVVKQKLGDDYGNALSAIFRPRDAAPGAAHQAIMALGPRIVLTTNYDLLLEAVEGPLLRQPYTWLNSAKALGDLTAGRNVLFKLHGSAEDEASVVLTQDEYAEVRKHAAYRTVVDHLLIANSFLFVGYGMSDPHDLDIVLAENTSALRGAGSIHYALLKRLSSEQAEADRREMLFRDHRIAVIPFDNFTEVVPFLDALARA